MILKTLHLQGFTSYIDSKIDFNDNIVATINAPNGFGKSSILEAITTALFYRARGTDTRGAGMDNLINNTCDQFIITLEFVLGGNDYKIIRKKTRDGKHELEFYINNESQTEKIADTQNKINSIIKMNYETFLDTVCIGQGLSNNFMKKKPAERKDVFVEILNLNDYTILEKYTKDLKKKLNEKIEVNQAKLNVLNETFEQKDSLEEEINNYNTQAEKLNSQIENLTEQFEKEQQARTQYELMQKQQQDILQHKLTLENNVQQLNNKLNNLKIKYQQTVDKFNEDKKQLTTLQKENENLSMPDKFSYEKDKQVYNDYIQQLQEELDASQKQLTECETTIKINKSEIQQLKNKYDQLDKYNKAVCEFCGNDITPEHKEKHLSQIMQQAKALSEANKKFKVEDIQQSIVEKKTLIQDYKLKIKECDNQIQLANDIKIQYEHNKSQINILENNLQLYKNQVADFKADKGSFSSELEQANKQLEKYKNIEILPNKTFNDGVLKQQLNTLQQQLNTINGNIQFNKNKLIEISNNQQIYNTLQKEQKQYNIKITDYDSLIEAFGKKGIQADIIANVLPDIENEINEVLKILFNNSLSIEFTTQKESKSNTTLETLDIIIHDKGSDRYYETYSGGEKFRIDFAFHVGLSKFLAKRANANIEFFIVDEGLGSQDDEGKENFILIINKLRQLFNQIFIITHIEEIKDAFDKKIIINKDPVLGSQIIQQ